MYMVRRVPINGRFKEISITNVNINNFKWRKRIPKSIPETYIRTFSILLRVRRPCTVSLGMRMLRQHFFNSLRKHSFLWWEYYYLNGCNSQYISYFHMKLYQCLLPRAAFVFGGKVTSFVKIGVAYRSQYTIKLWYGVTGQSWTFH